jgi:hypothetical protein
LQVLRLQNVAVYRQPQVTTSPLIVTYISIYFLWRHFFLQIGVSNYFYCTHKHFLNFKFNSSILKYEILYIVLLLYLRLFSNTLAMCTRLEFLQLWKWKSMSYGLWSCVFWIYIYIYIYNDTSDDLDASLIRVIF